MSARCYRVTLLALVFSFACGCGNHDREAPRGGSEAGAEVASAEPKFRNPFGLKNDVVDCCGAEAEFWAEGAPQYGSDDDENAEEWTDFGEQAEYDSIEGEWRSRWNPDQWWNEGYATIKFTDDGRVWIHYRDDPDVLGPLRTT